MFALGFYVTKAGGFRQEFDKEKVVKTCLRMGADTQLAREVAERIEDHLYDGIPTGKILQMIFRFMRKNKPEVGHLFDLRKGLSLMSSMPEFEKFVQILLANYDFDVSPNRILRGKCGEHEVDAVAKKNGVTFFVEAKHHSSYHSPTGLDESRIARAVLEDVTEGYELGVTDLKIDRAMIVTNTKYSDHAVIYGNCRNILQIGWSSPANGSLQSIIEEKKLYPLSCLRMLNFDLRTKLVYSGVVLIKQLFEKTPQEIAGKADLPPETVKKIVEAAKASAHPIWVL